MALTDGLLYYYKLNDNATDEVDSNSGTAFFVTYVAGKLGQGAYMDGSSSYILGSQTVNQADTTVSAWVNITTVPGTQGYICGLCQGNGGTLYDHDLLMNTDGTVKFYIYSAGARYSPDSGVLATGEWVHLVGTNDSSVVSLYVNGSLIGSNPSGPAYTAYTGANTMIGGNTAGYGYTECVIDEVGYWDRALSADEVTALYNGGAGLTYPFITNQAGILSLL